MLKSHSQRMFSKGTFHIHPQQIQAAKSTKVYCPHTVANDDYRFHILSDEVLSHTPHPLCAEKRFSLLAVNI